MSGWVHISRVRMVGFKSFDDYTLFIPPGLTFICGPNESGKTGIMDAIRLGLFTDAATTRRNILDYIRWGSGEGFKIEVDLETREGTWELTRDFETGRNTLKNPDGALVRDKNEILKRITELLGIPEAGAEEAYMASLCVMQDEMLTGGEALKRLVESRVLGLSVDAVKLAKDAEWKIRDLRKGSHGGLAVGLHTAARRRVEGLREQLDAVSRRVNESLGARGRATALREQSQRLAGEVSVLETTLDRAKRYAVSKKTHEEQSQRLVEVTGDIEEHEKLKARLSKLAPEIEKLAEQEKDLREQLLLKRRVQEMEGQIVRLQEEKSRHLRCQEAVEDLVNRIATLKEQLDSFPPLDPQRVNEIYRLEKSCELQKEDLERSQKALDELLSETVCVKSQLFKLRQEEERLVNLSAADGLGRESNALSFKLRQIEEALLLFRKSMEALSGLVPISEKDVERVGQLASDLKAMKGVPPGLNLRLDLAHGVQAALGTDGKVPELSSGSQVLSVRKAFTLQVPQVLDLAVSVSDGEQFLKRQREVGDLLREILGRYGVASVTELSEAYRRFARAEESFSKAREHLCSLLSGTPSEDIAISASGEIRRITDLLDGAQNMLSKKLSALGMLQEDLESLDAGALEHSLKEVRENIGSLSHRLAGLEGSVSGLRVGEKRKALADLEDALARALGETGCDCVGDLRQKSLQKEGLLSEIVGLRATAEGLLGEVFETLKEGGLTPTVETGLSHLKDTVDSVDGRIAVLKEEARGLFTQEVSFDLVQTLEKTSAERKEKESSKDQFLGRLGGLKMEDLQARKAEALGALLPAKQEMEETLPYRMSPSDMVLLERDLEEKKGLLETVSNEALKAEALAGMTLEGSEDVARIQEELDEAERHLAQVEREIEVLSILKDVFLEARTQAVSGTFHRLAKASSRYVDLMTGGKYQGMEISQDFSPLLYSHERGKAIDGLAEKHLLSAGTFDQVLLAVRLAVSDLLSSGKRPPIMMDDPFVHFDSERRAAGIEALRQISRHYQTIVFTCHDYPELAGEQTVRLGVTRL